MINMRFHFLYQYYHYRQQLNYAPCDYANTKCFSLGTKQTISTVDAVRLLVSVSPAIDPIAREAPFRPEDHCLFIVHEKSLHTWEDVLSDSNGKWTSKDGPKSTYYIRIDGELISVPKEEFDADEGGYHFTR